MKSIDICLSPALLPYFPVQGSTVVIIDILRATSTMVTALAHGAECIVPVATLEECAELGRQGYLTAAERDGDQAPGFDLGNSPLALRSGVAQGRRMAISTTNGTQAIAQSAGAHTIIAGAFLNLSAVVEYLQQQPNDIVLVCAGWKNMVNAEDTLFAGAVAEQLKEECHPASDAVTIAQVLYRHATQDMTSFLKNSGHVQRLNHKGIYEDVAFCLQIDEYAVIPVLRQGALWPHTLPQQQPAGNSAI